MKVAAQRQPCKKWINGSAGTCIAVYPDRGDPLSDYLPGSCKVFPDLGTGS
ncbi:rCG57354 [Rattus norvegicus]|uniref:RCG57354 n=1 Tax=Rattus norvegicus TaxID=10116 RepID=A6JPB1_RAT|nr:rCG57354 [Rattus norvegicus]